MPDGNLADLIAADPAGAWHALNCADARDSFADFCGMVELPGVVIGAEPATRDRKQLPNGTWVDDDDDTGAVGDLSFRPIETPQAAHHKALIELCQRIESGEVRRAMVFMPPGSAKSTYASVAFPAWYMGKRRGRSVGVATYATGLARKVGRRIRAIVRQKVYREIMGTGLSRDQGAVNEWALESGSDFMGEGILAGWTGNRLDGLVVDDPVKNREEADSEIMQAKVLSEFNDSLKSRLKPGGWTLIIQTRWNENDLSGQILPEGWDGESGPIKCRDGLVWEVLCIPAEAEENDPLGRKPGEMLWPEWFGRDPDFWTAARRIARTWSALYQQRPSAQDGTFFQRSWFRRYRVGSEPANLRVYLTSDHAPTEDETSDPSGCRAWGVARGNDVYLLDGFQHRADMSVTAERIIDLIQRWKPYAWFPEDDNNFKSAWPFILLRMRARDARTRVEPMSPHGQDKAAKAQSFQGMAASGQWFIPEGPEGDAIIDQYVKFPAGRHDEEVDMAAIMGRAVAMAHPAIVVDEAPAPTGPKPLNETTYDEVLERLEPVLTERV
jgi:predicted phage terminase large subunit-like protein